MKIKLKGYFVVEIDYSHIKVSYCDESDRVTLVPVNERFYRDVRSPSLNDCPSFSSQNQVVQKTTDSFQIAFSESSSWYSWFRMPCNVCASFDSSEHHHSYSSSSIRIEGREERFFAGDYDKGLVDRGFCEFTNILRFFEATPSWELYSPVDIAGAAHKALLEHKPSSTSRFSERQQAYPALLKCEKFGGETLRYSVDVNGAEKTFDLPLLVSVLLLGVQKWVCRFVTDILQIPDKGEEKKVKFPTRFVCPAPFSPVQKSTLRDLISLRCTRLVCSSSFELVDDVSCHSSNQLDLWRDADSDAALVVLKFGWDASHVHLLRRTARTPQKHCSLGCCASTEIRFSGRRLARAVLQKNAAGGVGGADSFPASELSEDVVTAECVQFTVGSTTATFEANGVDSGALDQESMLNSAVNLLGGQSLKTAISSLFPDRAFEKANLRFLVVGCPFVVRTVYAAAHRALTAVKDADVYVSCLPEFGACVLAPTLWTCVPTASPVDQTVLTKHIWYCPFSVVIQTSPENYSEILPRGHKLPYSACVDLFPDVDDFRCALQKGVWSVKLVFFVCWDSSSGIDVTKLRKFEERVVSVVCKNNNKNVPTITLSINMKDSLGFQIAWDVKIGKFADKTESRCVACFPRALPNTEMQPHVLNGIVEGVQQFVAMLKTDPKRLDQALKFVFSLDPDAVPMSRVSDWILTHAVGVIPKHVDHEAVSPFGIIAEVSP
eukprot:ANDGO_01675.mRNA.1 hypothetical protein